MTEYQSDNAILAELGSRLSSLRVSQNMTQASLAREAGISKRTLERIEAGQSAQITNFVRVLRVLNVLDRLETLLPRPETGPMDLLKSSGKTPQRASRRGTTKEIQPWQWGDDQ